MVSEYLGHRFGYIHQFGLFTSNQAKTLTIRPLRYYDLTFNYAYLS